MALTITLDARVATPRIRRAILHLLSAAYISHLTMMLVKRGVTVRLRVVLSVFALLHLGLTMTLLTMVVWLKAWRIRIVTFSRARASLLCHREEEEEEPKAAPCLRTYRP